ncbi:MAG: hypothetical protein BWY04_00184 [candidate division CPR1 bacterium ADurb.Bin160]|uniref:Uncharacterized protein n=1 Tax=candidate division CPR1 bacterium ADurb.Bin160 TaxID=1852826 RepID=A0A1V5ZRQ9_9BACT|nr:MAG: hypothetical protein BWY04_00184 [candidate division CPR1 bacterium ADurb.Bin160]
MISCVFSSEQLHLAMYKNLINSLSVHLLHHSAILLATLIALFCNCSLSQKSLCILGLSFIKKYIFLANFIELFQTFKSSTFHILVIVPNKIFSIIDYRLMIID